MPALEGRSRDLRGKGQSVGFTGNYHPVSRSALEPAVGPFDIRHGDAAIGPALDHVDHVFGRKGGNIALTLAACLFLVDGVGNIHGKHEFDIDLDTRLLSCRRPPGPCKQNGRCRDREIFDRTHHVAKIRHMPAPGQLTML